MEDLVVKDLTREIQAPEKTKLLFWISSSFSNFSCYNILKGIWDQSVDYQPVAYFNGSSACESFLNYLHLAK